MSLHSSRRVREYCVQRGFSWAGSAARTICAEQDYYEELVRFYRGAKRVCVHAGSLFGTLTRVSA